MNEENLGIDDKTALINFLKDIECLDSLDEWLGSFSLFDVLKITRAEIRHSNMLAWLLDPNESHGLGDAVLRGVFEYYADNYLDGDDVLDTFLIDCDDFYVRREWKNIDIIAVSDKQEIVLCIENKVDAGETGDQLKRYPKAVQNAYKRYRAYYLFLTPDARDASEENEERWRPIGYENILEIIERALGRVELQPEAELLIENYVRVIRRDILEDEKLEQVCREIYEKHKQALDLLFEHRPDYMSDAAAVFREWAAKKACDGDIIFDPNYCNKTYTRFKTPKMSDWLPDGKRATSDWHSKNCYFYEIQLREHSGVPHYRLQLSLNSDGISRDNKAKCERIMTFTNVGIRKNWHWSSKTFQTDWEKLESDDGVDESGICKTLNKFLKKAQKFESELEEMFAAQDESEDVV